MQVFAIRLAAAAAIGASCAAASASVMVQLNQGSFSSGNGGEFNAVIVGAPFALQSLTGGSVETFCLEKSENFQPGQWYEAEFLTYASGGGGGASGGQDPLDERTAFLYSAFITGTLPGYDFSNSMGLRQQHAGALQRAIWFLENEVDSLDSPESIAFHAFSAGGVGMGIGNARVMQVFKTLPDGSIEDHQDQIVIIPAPASLGVFAAAALAFRRRRSN